MKTLLLALTLVCAVAAAPPIERKSVKAVPLKVEGDTVVVVKSFPITITASAGAGYYSWKVPTGVTYTESFNILTVTAAPKGSHKITVDAISGRLGPDKVMVEFMVDRGETTINVGVDVTPPKPPPDPDVPPDPPPDPTVKGPLRVLIVFEEEKAGEYPKEQHSILYGERFAKHLNSLTERDPNMKGRNRWNVWDQNTVVTAAPKEWQDAMKRERKSLPWLLMFGDDGSVYHEGPLPKTVDEAIAVVSKYAPKKGVK